MCFHKSLTVGRICVVYFQGSRRVASSDSLLLGSIFRAKVFFSVGINREIFLRRLYHFLSSFLKSSMSFHIAFVIIRRPCATGRMEPQTFGSIKDGFPMAVVENHHKLSGLKRHRFVTVHFLRLEVPRGSHWSKIQVLAGPCQMWTL